MKNSSYRSFYGLFSPYNKLLKTMKITLLLSIVFTFGVYASNSYAQDAKLSLNLNNVTLKELLNEIGKKSEFSFWYSYNDLNEQSRITLALKDQSIDQILGMALKGQNLSYEIKDKVIVIYKPSDLNNINSSQQLKVSGTVTDAVNNEPLPGVNILVEGSTFGTTTDMDGKYSIEVPSPKSVLVFSFVGYNTERVQLNEQSARLDISLIPDVKKLDEVIVIGYGTVDKKELTSAVSHVSSSDLLQVGTTNPIMSLQGKVAGLTITNTGGSDPNASPSIQLRGVSSRDAGSSPLIVIDGVSGGNLENINPNDIASIDVLKDGAASAIYGTRGSSGVIIITTKKGTTGTMTATYSGYVSADFANHKLKSLSAEEYVKNNRGTDYGGKTDWLKEVSKDYALAQNHSLSLSGGNSSNTYHATIDYRKADGLDLRSNREEYGARLALNHNAPSKLYSVSVNLAPRYFKRNDANYDIFTQALTLNPTYPVKDINDPNKYTSITGNDGQFNPVELSKLEKSGSEAKFLDWDGTFKLNLTKTLNTQVTLAQNSKDYFDFWFRPSNMTTEIQNGYTGEARRTDNRYDQKSFEWLANYSLIAGNHSLKAMAGYSYLYNQSSGLSAENKNFTSNALTYNNIGDGLYQQVEGRNGMSSSKEDSKLISFFGRLSYSFADKYLMTASLRKEGSSKFGTNNKWGYFPAISFGWRISKESFMQNISWLDELKLRGDYGVTGNQNFGNYLSLSTYSGYGYYYFNGSYYQVWGPGNNTNTDLKWELGKNYNIGIDFAVFNSRIEGSINYYRRKQEDLLGWYNAPVPPNPQSQTYANVGSMLNTGIEIDLNLGVIRGSDFTYNIEFVGATNNNKFLSFSNDLFKGQNYVDLVGLPAPGTPGNAQRLQEGERIGNFYMWKFAGVDQNGNMLVYNKANEVIQANAATNDDKRIVGNGLPHFTASMNHSFRYKNWDLQLYFRGAFGYDIFNMHDFYYGLQSSTASSNVTADAYGKNGLIKGDKVLCDYFLEKGDYVKLDVVNLGYTIKTSVKYLSSVRIYATGRNLARLTGFSGVDPEAYPINGLTPGITGSKAYYPSTAQILVGAQISF